MSELTEYWNKKKIVSRPYDPTGCPVPLGEGKCGETKGFEILMEFHKLYQDKISSIDVTAGGDSLQEKVDIQQDWINDLTEQNRLMARAIEELELEAIDKVQALEEKLLDYSKSLSEDEEKLNEKDRIIKELQESLATRTKTFDSAADISKETDKSNSLHESVKGTVASQEILVKNDTISRLRYEIHQMKETCLQMSTENDLKDNVIKELRREVKKTKHQQRRNSMNNNCEKAIQVSENELKTASDRTVKFLNVHHSIKSEDSNSTVIYLNANVEDSPDECNVNVVHTSKSENDIKSIRNAIMNRSRDRSRLTRSNPKGDSVSGKNEMEKYLKRQLLVPRHMPVKTYVNNIESKEI